MMKRVSCTICKYVENQTKVDSKIINKNKTGQSDTLLLLRRCWHKKPVSLIPIRCSLLFPTYCRLKNNFSISG